MRLCTVSHSHVHLRQQLFFQEIARQGHEVLMVAPGEWGFLRAISYSLNFRDNDGKGGVFDLKTCRHIGESIYNFKLLGARDAIRDFSPDWLYIQDEPGSEIIKEAVDWKAKKRAAFTWENVRLKETLILGKYDLVVCGNPEAEALVRIWNSNTALLLQVGVDINHFQARPSIARDIDVAYIGRMVPEKGLPYLSQAWPAVKFMAGIDYEEIPWWYSQAKVVVAYSQDTPHWKEQAPNYVVLEALSCGCKAVVSTTPAMVYWLEGCPGVIQVEGHTYLGENGFSLQRVSQLKDGIQRALAMEIGDEGRQWVVEKFSNPVVARKLVEVFENA